MDDVTNQVMAKIREGMDVYDLEGEKVGTVEFIQMGDEDPTNLEVEAATDQKPTSENRTWIDDFAQVLAPGNDLPPEMVERLRRYGYVRVDAGMLKSDRFFTNDQIAGVTEDRVNLSVNEDTLLKS